MRSRGIPAAMQPEVIETPSRRQVMDWSLVLLSQGIESTIEYRADDGRWVLELPDGELTRALTAIQTYEAENRAWPWRQPVFHQTALFDWASLAWAVLIVAFYVLDPARAFEAGGALSGVAVRHGEWWRCFTAVWLHADLAHLTGNAMFGCLLLGLALGRYGTGRGLLAAYLAGAAANLARCVAVPATRMGLGASGMVMGALGLLAVQYVPTWGVARQPLRYLLAGLSAGVMLFVLLGVAPESDVLVHAAGFVFGVLFGLVLNLQGGSVPRPRFRGEVACGILFILLVIWPWWLAWRHA